MTKAEREPWSYKGGWFYVGPKTCSFHTNLEHVHGVPTKKLLRALFQMNMQRGAKKARSGKREEEK